MPRYPTKSRSTLLRTLLFASSFVTSAQAPPTHNKTIEAASAAMQAGTAAANRNDLPEARRHFAHAVELAPQAEATHAALGSVLLALRELEPARRELERAHKLSPTDIATTLNLARTESLLGRSPRAVSLFQSALATAPQPTLSEEEELAYANALATAGNPTAAEAELRAGLSHTPGSAALHNALGTLLATTGQLPEANTELDRAVTLDPQPAYQSHLGAVLIALGHPEEALPPLRNATQLLPSDFDTHLHLGRALSALHQDAPALAELHRAIELRPTDVPPAQAYALALALEASGDPRSSLPFFALAVQSPSLGTDPLINQAVALVQTGDAASAIPLYAKALTLGPDSPTLREDYGVAYLQQSDLDHAIEQFRAGLILDPQSAHLHYDLGLAFKLKDDLAHAIPELERSAQIDPTLPDPAYTLGILYMQQGRSAEAATQLRRATTLQPSNAEAWAVLASVLKEADPPAAIDALHQAITLAPNQPGLHIQLAALYVRSGDPAGAAAERKRAADLSRLAMSQQRATFALNSGRALLAEGKLPEAITQLTAAAQADPSLADPHKLLADALARQGKSIEAARERLRAQELDHPSREDHPRTP